MDNFFKLEEKKEEEEGRMVHLEPLCSCFKIILHHDIRTELSTTWKRLRMIPADDMK